MSARLADLPAVTPARVLELKKEAAALKTSAGIKQSAALARIAQREGFDSWERLMARVGGRDVVDAEKRSGAPTPAVERRAERAQRFGGRP